MKNLSQTQRLYNLLKDGEPHSTVEIMRKVYGKDHLGLARVGARIYDIKKRHEGNIASWRDLKRKTVHWYQMDIQENTVFE